MYEAKCWFRPVPESMRNANLDDDFPQIASVRHQSSPLAVIVTVWVDSDQSEVLVLEIPLGVPSSITS